MDGPLLAAGGRPFRGSRRHRICAAFLCRMIAPVGQPLRTSTDKQKTQGIRKNQKNLQIQTFCQTLFSNLVYCLLGEPWKTNKSNDHGQSETRIWQKRNTNGEDKSEKHILKRDMTKSTKSFPRAPPPSLNDIWASMCVLIAGSEFHRGALCGMVDFCSGLCNATHHHYDDPTVHLEFALSKRHTQQFPLNVQWLQKKQTIVMNAFMKA